MEMTENTEEGRGERGRVGRDVVISTVSDSLRTSLQVLDVRNFIHQPTIHPISIGSRKGNESAYTPTQFPIGPYHRHKHVKDVKLFYLKNLLDRNPNHNKVEKYASAVKSSEEEARDCYHDRCKGVKSEDFVEMMVLDGCFIIELFLKVGEGKFKESRIKKYLRHDLMLMENQIPFFILKLILDNSQYQVEGVGGILDLSLHCLYILGCSAGKNITKDRLKPDQSEKDGKNIYHLLHLNYLCHMVEIDPEMEPFSHMVYMLEMLKWVLYWVFLCPIKYFLLVFFYALFFFLKSIKLATKAMRRKPNFHNRRKVRAERQQKKPSMLPTATELKEYGVIFKRKKNAKNYMDVSFENGIMEIPVVSIQDSTNSAFRNFLALEYFCPNLGNKFTTYVVFLDDLIDTTSDVSFLKSRKIIESVLGCDEDVTKMFNAITVELMWESKRHYLLKLFKDVHAHWKKDHHRWRATMMRNYFSSPWSIMSLLAAFTLLAMTAVQVYYTIINSSV